MDLFDTRVPVSLASSTSSYLPHLLNISSHLAKSNYTTFYFHRDCDRDVYPSNLTKLRTILSLENYLVSFYEFLRGNNGSPTPKIKRHRHETSGPRHSFLRCWYSPFSVCCEQRNRRRSFCSCLHLSTESRTKPIYQTSTRQKSTRRSCWRWIYPTPTAPSAYRNLRRI